VAFDRTDAGISIARIRLQPDTADRVESVAHSVAGVRDTRRIGS
jgi:hypothetical protein